MDPHSKYQTVTTFIFDVDGVLTDGNLEASSSGDLLRRMNTRDGYAIKKAIEEGFRIGIITGGNSIGVEKRLAGLGIKDIYLNIKDKFKVLDAYMKEHYISSEQILYMGDDIPDIRSMNLAYYKSCPKDADHEVRKICDYISPIKGGEGCVRDIIEKVMRIQDKWQ